MPLRVQGGQTRRPNLWGELWRSGRSARRKGAQHPHGQVRDDSGQGCVASGCRRRAAGGERRACADVHVTLFFPSSMRTSISTVADACPQLECAAFEKKEEKKKGVGAIREGDKHAVVSPGVRQRADLAVGTRARPLTRRSGSAAAPTKTAACDAEASRLRGEPPVLGSPQLTNNTATNLFFYVFVTELFGTKRGAAPGCAGLTRCRPRGAAGRAWAPPVGGSFHCLTSTIPVRRPPHPSRGSATAPPRGCDGQEDNTEE